MIRVRVCVCVCAIPLVEEMTLAAAAVTAEVVVAAVAGDHWSVLQLWSCSLPI